MPDDVTIIDLMEGLRRALTQAFPPLSDELDALRRLTWRDQPDGFFREKLVAVLLSLDLDTAEGRRRARSIVRQLTAGDPLAGALGEAIRDSEARAAGVAEDPDRRFGVLRQALDGLASLGDGRGIAVRLATCADPASAATLIRKQIPQLNGLNTYRFLRLANYDVLTPDGSRRRLLFRLGLLEGESPSAAPPLVFQEVGARLARLTGEPHGVVDLLLGLYSGAICRPRQIAPICRTKPRCGECPLAARCSYFRFRGAPRAEPVSSIRAMSEASRPREKLEKFGPERVNDAELLAILLRTGTTGRSALDVAADILRRFETLDRLHAATLAELREIPGVGRGKAVEIQAALELGRRRLDAPLPLGPAICNSQSVFGAYRARVIRQRKEVFLVLCVNAKNQVTHEFEISSGSLSQSVVHPREAFAPAIRESAHGVLFLHNHPSGDPRPSAADNDLTRRLREAGEILNIRVLDHIIIGDRTFYSFADNGQI